MKFRRKPTAMLVVVIFALSMAFTTAPASSDTNIEPDQTAVKLGLLTPKSGALGGLGISFENGANLAIDDLNAMQDDFEFSLQVEDTETDETATGAAMTSLVQAGVSGVVGAASSANTIVAAGIAKENHIPMVSYASTSPSISDLDDDDFLFRVVPSDAYQGLALADLVTGDITNASVGLIALNNAYGQGLATSFSNALSANNGSVDATFSYPSTQEDFSSMIGAVDSLNPDAVVMVSYNTDGAAILDEIALQNLNVPVYGTDGTKSPEIFNDTSAVENYAGMKGTAPLVKNDTQFYNNFVGNYSTAPSIFVPESYDATMILGKALIEANTGTACKVADNLRTVGTNYDGVSGEITFDSNGDQVAASYEYWQAETNETFSQLGTWEGDATVGEGDFPDTHCPPEADTVITTVISGETIVSTLNGTTVQTTETLAAPIVKLMLILSTTLVAVTVIRRRFR